MSQIWYTAFLFVMLTFNGLKVSGDVDMLFSEKYSSSLSCSVQKANVATQAETEHFFEETGDESIDCVFRVIIGRENRKPISFSLSKYLSNKIAATFILFEADNSPPFIG